MEPLIQPLIVIVGQTAVGKSDLAVRLAQKYDGEIICADSRTVYKDLNIGTAKPAPENRANIPHHLLDIAEPGEEFSVAKFKELARSSIESISERGKLPILAGGTGLYIDALVYNFQLGEPKNQILRNQLESMPDEDLQRKAQKLGITEAKVNFSNRRHLIRAIERGGVFPSDKTLRPRTLLIGLSVPPDKLKQKIKQRIDKMMAAGLEEEVAFLAKRFGFNAPGMNTICYSEWEPYFAGEQTLEQIKENLYKNTWQYARRQKTWFTRNQNINWITSDKEAFRLVKQFLIQ